MNSTIQITDNGQAHTFTPPQRHAITEALALEGVWGAFEKLLVVSDDDASRVADEIFQTAALRQVSVDEFAYWADGKYSGVLAELARRIVGTAANSALLLKAMLPEEPLVITPDMQPAAQRKAARDAEIRASLGTIGSTLEKATTAQNAGDYLEALRHASDAESACQFIVAIMSGHCKTRDGAYRRAINMIEHTKAFLVVPIFVALRSKGRTHELVTTVG